MISRLLVFGVIASVLSFGSPAGATDTPSGCEKDYAKIWWVGFPSSLSQQAKNGANWWEGRKHWQGNEGAIVVTDGSFWSNNIEANWIPQSSGWGFGNCTTSLFAMNSNKQAEWENDPAMFRSVIAHELGHTLGFSHVGDSDSWDSRTPVMTTCRGATLFSQDDAAGANAMRNRTGNYYNLSANSSFENGSLYWGMHNSGSWTRSNGVDGSQKYLEIDRQGGTSYIWNTTRVMDNQGHTIDWVIARANYRKDNASDVGHIKVILRVGREYFPNGETCGWPDFSGWDGVEAQLNQGVRTPHWYIWNPKTCVPTQSWNFCSAAGVNPNNVDAIDARVYVYNNMGTAGGALADVDLDRVRVMVDY